MQTVLAGWLPRLQSGSQADTVPVRIKIVIREGRKPSAARPDRVPQWSSLQHCSQDVHPEIRAFTSVLWRAKDGAEVVDSTAADPDGARVGGRQREEGGEQSCEEDVHREVHHEDGDPDARARSGRSRCRLWLRRRCQARADVVLEHPDRHPQELRAQHRLQFNQPLCLSITTLQGSSKSLIA